MFFLFPIAKKSFSYVRNTFDLISKINKLSDGKNYFHDSYLDNMDVLSLHRNTYHDEGFESCNKAFEKRKNKTIPSLSLHLYGLPWKATR